MFRSIFLTFFLFVFSLKFLKADDKQLGKLNFYRSCHDVKHYEIKLNVHPSSHKIEGYNKITTHFTQATALIQIDFVPGMRIPDISIGRSKLSFIRKGRAVLIRLPRKYMPEEIITFTVWFEGQPEVATNPPWKGGFVWSKDKDGNDWVGLACESKGASVWLPCKDHWSDEPDSVDLFLGVPRGLTGVSNGRFLESTYSDSFVTYHWKTVNPINHYNISINVGKYARISDEFMGLNGPLRIEYYVLNYNAPKAIKHFREVDTMLRAFETYFGPYPFYEDGYKLVETPYWGMEHQSCIAYGNNYRYNAYGFDFIIVHESGHEWFANSITANDPADLWIHESFTTYSESLFIEFTQGYDSAISYLMMQRKNIVSKKPIQGIRNIDFHNRKDNDIYYKGTWVLHTLRHHIQNDSLWWQMLKGINSKFKHQLTCTDSVVKYVESKLQLATSSKIFKQYLYNSTIPVLSVKKVVINGEWFLETKFNGVVKNFELNLKLSNSKSIRVSDKLSRHPIDKDFDLQCLNSLMQLYLIKVKY